MTHGARGWTGFGPRAVLLAAATFAPSVVDAQPRFYLRGNLDVSERYEDNLFFTSFERKGDLVSRVSPRVAAGYRGHHFRVAARYGLHGEKFGRRHELDSALAGQEAMVEVHWDAGALSSATTASYAKTTSAHDLNLLTGLQMGRFPAERLGGQQQLALRLGKRTRLVADGHIARQSGGTAPDLEETSASLRLERRVGPSDTVSVDYGARRFATTDGGPVTHLVGLAWSTRVSPLVQFEIKAGPRLTAGGRVGPELTASLHGRTRRGDVSVAYMKTESAVVGLAGPVATSGVLGQFTHRLSRTVSLSAAPSLMKSRGERLDATVYRLGAEMAWRVHPRLTIAGSHAWSRQEGRPGTIGGDRPVVINTTAFRVSTGTPGS